MYVEGGESEGETERARERRESRGGMVCSKAALPLPKISGLMRSISPSCKP